MFKKLMSIVTLMCAFAMADTSSVTEPTSSAVIESSSSVIESSATVPTDTTSYIGETFALTATSLIMMPSDNTVSQYLIKNPADSIKLAKVISILNHAKVDNNTTWESINVEVPLCGDKPECTDLIKINLAADTSINVTAIINDSTYTLAGFMVEYDVDPMMALICALIVAVLGGFGIKIKLSPEASRKIVDTTK